MHEKGQTLSDDGDDLAAIEEYLKAIKLHPEKAESLYNIGLIYKYLGEWGKSLEFNARAYEIDPEDESSRWNLAIASTALRKWDIARSAWKDNGIKMEGEKGPINMDFGRAPVRLNPNGDGEVVWGTRIDPVRVRIENIPYPESGYKFDDVVLHDGAAVGYRESNGQEYPVFNVLELFESSEYATVVATVRVQGSEDLLVLENALSEIESELEDWTGSVKLICKQCSEGAPHDHHVENLEETWLEERRVGIATTNVDRLQQVLDKWQSSGKGVLLGLE